MSIIGILHSRIYNVIFDKSAMRQHYGHFQQIFVQKYSIFGQKPKNGRCAQPKNIRWILILCVIHYLFFMEFLLIYSDCNRTIWNGSGTKWYDAIVYWCDIAIHAGDWYFNFDQTCRRQGFDGVIYSNFDRGLLCDGKKKFDFTQCTLWILAQKWYG